MTIWLREGRQRMKIRTGSWELKPLIRCNPFQYDILFLYPFIYKSSSSLCFSSLSPLLSIRAIDSQSFPDQLYLHYQSAVCNEASPPSSIYFYTANFGPNFYAFVWFWLSTGIVKDQVNVIVIIDTKLEEQKLSKFATGLNSYQIYSSE